MVNNLVHGDSDLADGEGGFERKWEIMLMMRIWSPALAGVAPVVLYHLLCIVFFAAALLCVDC